MGQLVSQGQCAEPHPQTSIQASVFASLSQACPTVFGLQTGYVPRPTFPRGGTGGQAASYGPSRSPLSFAFFLRRSTVDLLIPSSSPTARIDMPSFKALATSSTSRSTKVFQDHTNARFSVSQSKSSREFTAG